MQQQFVTAGHDGTATAGDYGVAVAGHEGAATAGNRGEARAGNSGVATAGVGGAATVGEYGLAVAGDWGTATAAEGSFVMAGEMGTICIWRHDGERRRLIVGYVGENGIEPNVAYRLDREGRFVRADGGAA
jgi:hypothetical protein